MKKKGLIISTVVMVVILIASLTTATYAWFSSQATASVGNIAVNVQGSSSVQIGIKGDGAENIQANYLYGDVTYDGSKWTQGGVGLGTSVNTGLSLLVNAAVGSGTSKEVTPEGGGEAQTVWTMDETYTPANTLCTGSGSTFAELKDVKEAVVNGTADLKTVDVIDLDLGIRVASEDLTGTYCKITVTPNDNIMGMITALWLEIKVGTKTYSGDIFGSTIHWGSTANEVVFWFMINDSTETDALEYKPNATTGDNDSVITNFQIKMFISGYDSDCCNDAINTSATIAMEFDGLTAENPTPTGTQLTLA